MNLAQTLLEYPLIYLLMGIACGLIAKRLLDRLLVFFSKNKVIDKARLLAIDNSLTDGFVIINQTGQIIHINQATLNIFGYQQSSQLLGQNVSILMGQAQSNRHNDFLQTYLKTGKRNVIGTDRQLKGQKKDGSLMHVSLSVNEVKLPSAHCFTAFIRDISSEVEAHHQVEFQRNKFETLFNHCPDGILYVNSDLKILDANQQFLSLYGAPIENLLQQDINQLFCTDTPQLSHVRKLLHSMNEPWGQDEVLAHLNIPAPREVTVLISNQKISRAEGDLTIYVFRDISKELQLIAHTAEKNQTLELSESLVNIGYWRYNIEKRQLWCSDQIFKILAMDNNNNNLIDIEAIYTLIHPNDQQNAIDAIQQCFAHHLPLALSFKITLDHATNKQQDKHIVLKGISENKSDRLTAIYGVIQDISDRLGQEEKLRLTKERLERSQLFSNIGNWEWSITTGQVYWSTLAAPMFDSGHESLITDFDHFVNCVHVDDRQSVNSAISRCIEQAEKYNIEHRVVWSDQSVHWLHQQGDVVRDAKGKAMQMVGVVQDITERKAKETQLHLFKQIIESSSQAIRVCSDDGQLIYTNPAHQQLFIHNQQVEQHHFDDFLSHQAKESGVGQQMERSLNQNNHWSGEVQSKRTDDSLFPAHVAMSQFNDWQNKLNYRFSFCYDASEEIEQTEKLRQAKQAAEKANRAKSEFLSSMSHELRTPLNAVLGFSQLLLRQKQVPFTERITDNIQAIYKAGEHLLTLINGILELAKIESGKRVPNFEQVNIKQVIDEAVDLVIPQAEERGLSLHTPQGSKIPVLYTQKQVPLVDGDFTLLKQALLNYLSNAIKYNKTNGIIFITVDINSDTNTTRITVCDNGIGIASESICELFTPFNRLGLETSSVQGTGIGLAITKKNIESQHGNVGVKSKLGAGSSFWIDLPYIGLLDDNEGVSNKPNLIASNPFSLSGSRFTVLYVEDNLSNTELMQNYFDNIEEVSLITASNAELGTVLAGEYLPQIILLDLNLPGMDGYAALQEMKINPQLSDTSFIAVTADVMSKTRDKVEAAGFDAFLSKPISFEALHQYLNLYAQGATQAKSTLARQKVKSGRPSPLA